MTLQIPGAVVDKVIQGRAIARHVREQAAVQAARLAAQGIQLKLAVILVGDDPASQVYVRHKVKGCAEVGIESEAIRMPAETSLEALLAEVERLNDDDSVDGVLVQLPLPPHLNKDVVISALAPRKDVDGFHPTNLGLLVARTPLLQPCTPAGIMLMLRAVGVDLVGCHAVVVGRSITVGRPVAQLLVQSHATVTVCHRHTRDLAEHVARADLVIVATGVPNLIKGGWIRPGAVVIDVGISRKPDGKLNGDVDFEPARARASAITPVPGGVGPMTIAMLLWNTVLAGAFRRELGREGLDGLVPF